MYSDDEDVSLEDFRKVIANDSFYDLNDFYTTQKRNPFMPPWNPVFVVDKDFHAPNPPQPTIKIRHKLTGKTIEYFDDREGLSKFKKDIENKKF